MRRNYLGLMLLAMASLAVGSIAVLAGGQGGAAGVTPAGTVFTYQGQLDQGGVRVNSTCDYEFSLWDAAIGPTQVGLTQSVNSVTVTDGLFTVQLDFGAAAFNGNARWLEIAVRCPAGAGVFTTLTPRQPLTPAPYAVRSLAPWAVSPTNKSDIFYETGNVGIGIASPQARFHLDAGSVFGQTPFQVVGEDFNTGLIARFRRSNPLEPSITMLTVGNNKAILASEKSWRFDTDAVGNSVGIPRMTILHGSGNVGIGTTAPSARLSLSEQLRLFDSAPPGTASDAGYLFGPSIPSGMVTEVSGQLLDFAVNTPQIGPRDINRVGGLVRIDTRLEAPQQSFNIQGYPVGSNTNFPRLFINLNTGQTNLAPGGGNVGIGTIFDPIHPLQMASGAHVTVGGVWTDGSDANRKENINPVDAREILKRVRELQISTWNFKDENESIRHLGPTAQDFHAAFALGADDKHLASLDSGGVALAAIQGLDELVREREKEITDLKARLAALEALVQQLASPSNGGAP